MQAPDFAFNGPLGFDQKDLLFLFEHFPVPGVDAVEAVRRVHEQPNTLESLLESRFLRDALLDRSAACLDVSPRLFFDVMLRHALPGRRTPLERSTIHYLANLLGLFSRTERVYRLQQYEQQRYEYLADLVMEAHHAGYERRFLVDAHIGNYSLFLSGMCSEWVNHRLRYHKRPISLEYYRRMGRSYYASASSHPASTDLGLRDIFRHLSERFEHFREGLERLARQVFIPRPEMTLQLPG